MWPATCWPGVKYILYKYIIRPSHLDGCERNVQQRNRLGAQQQIRNNITGTQKSNYIEIYTGSAHITYACILDGENRRMKNSHEHTFVLTRPFCFFSLHSPHT